MTADGTRIAADAVLAATGPAVPLLAAEVGYVIPDATPISLLLRTKPVATGLRAPCSTRPGWRCGPIPGAGWRWMPLGRGGGGRAAGRQLRGQESTVAGPCARPRR
ncbi:MAG: hypothetical protein U1E17_04305 [Geminicoccaceae bacterium]